MSPFEIVMMSFVAAALAAACLAVRKFRRPIAAPPAEAPAPPAAPDPAEKPVSCAVDPPAPMPIVRAPKLTGEHHIDPPRAPFRLPPPPPEAVDIGQMELGQKIVLRTATAKYCLTLRDATLRAFDACRIGPGKDGPTASKSFCLLFHGTFLPDAGVYRGHFVPGGHLLYQKIVDEVVYRVSPSTRIVTVLFECRRADPKRVNTAA